MKHISQVIAELTRIRQERGDIVCSIEYYGYIANVKYHVTTILHGGIEEPLLVLKGDRP